MVIHAADISNPAKPSKISQQWTDKVYEEFFRQGDEEKRLGLSVSALCDRETTNVPKSQVGFIGGFIIPTYNFLVVMFPTLSYTVENAKDNLNRWQKLADEGRKRGWTPEKKEKEKKNGILKKKTNVVEINIE